MYEEHFCNPLCSIEGLDYLRIKTKKYTNEYNISVLCAYLY